MRINYVYSTFGSLCEADMYPMHMLSVVCPQEKCSVSVHVYNNIRRMLCSKQFSISSLTMTYHLWSR